ncbi:hypothetical protein RV10_GL002971 [Enterococcus pallens]|nr:hypothetical protein RV10_GL002971 [Enterococcus pallens]
MSLLNNGKKTPNQPFEPAKITYVQNKQKADPTVESAS